MNAEIAFRISKRELKAVAVFCLLVAGAVTGISKRELKEKKESVNHHFQTILNLKKRIESE